MATQASIHAEKIGNKFCDVLGAPKSGADGIDKLRAIAPKAFPVDGEATALNKKGTTYGEVLDLLGRVYAGSESPKATSAIAEQLGLPPQNEWLLGTIRYLNSYQSSKLPQAIQARGRKTAASVARDHFLSMDLDD